MGWQDLTSDTYWTPGLGSWSSTKWESEAFGGYNFVTLTPDSWATGYLPSKMKITATISPMVVIVQGSLTGPVEIYPLSGVGFDFTPYGEIQFIQIGVSESPFDVTKLEFFKEETLSLSGSSSAILTFPVVSVWEDGTIAWADGDVVWEFGITYPKLSVNSRVESLTCKVSLLYPRAITAVLYPQVRGVGLAPKIRHKNMVG